MPAGQFYLQNMPANSLLTDIKYLKGVGPVRAKILAEDLNAHTFRDLLYTFPYKYIDRSEIHTIRTLKEGMPYVQLRGSIVDIETEGIGRKKRLKAIFSDGTGYLTLIWFNATKSLEDSLRYDKTYLILGKPNFWNGQISIAHPEMEDCAKMQAEPGGLMPHYHTSERMKRAGVDSRRLGQWVQNLLDTLPSGSIEETLPAYVIAQHRLLPIEDALRTVHHPESSLALPPAIHRLKFEELFYLQLDILRSATSRRRDNEGYTFQKVGERFMQFYNTCLPFELTEAQKRVIREIRRDVGSGRQMNRLLQGDVGCGKTIVALLCCLLALDNGFQACIMAPTEILAEQHFATIRDQLADLPVTVELLTGSVKGKARKEIMQGIADGTIHILVGTHALIEPTVCFLNLGFVVIDEQHRFGVKQRAALWEKNVRPPHVLVMTATPIPRTLAMTVYGDLDVSVIDALPPGRKPIQTIHYTQKERGYMYTGMMRELAAGRQVYVVFPLIEGSEESNLQDLETGYNNLCDVFPTFKIGKVHGRMKPADKDAVMQAFKRRELNILVATTVIEVGVNVPNASVMVIENADRFGLSQLHQLRGRVGRGSDKAYCILMTDSKLTDSARRRMAVMVESTDGFVIAEEDMRLRGPGDMDGTQQSGMPFDLKIANLVRDTDLMPAARDTAAALLEQDPEERLPQNAVAWQQLKLFKKSQQSFSEIS